MKNLNKKGFTIMELLVSLAIIAMLFTATIALIGGVKEKSRDAKRMSDVREISKALVLYADNNDKFPIATTLVTITGSDVVSTALEGDDVISEVPTDPTHPTNPYTYISDSSGNTFIISFCLETDSIPNFSQGCGNTITP